MADPQNLNFIVTELIPRLNLLSATAEGKWGKMNAWQMVEHLSDFFKVSSGKIIMPLVSPPEYLPKLRAFMESDKEFKENTKAPEQIVPEEPPATRHTSYAAALDELQGEINDFISHFKDAPHAITTHPVFGELNFDDWVLLHYKHVMHHTKQFGVGGD